MKSKLFFMVSLFTVYFNSYASSAQGSHHGSVVCVIDAAMDSFNEKLSHSNDIYYQGPHQPVIATPDASAMTTCVGKNRAFEGKYISDNSFLKAHKKDDYWFKVSRERQFASWIKNADAEKLASGRLNYLNVLKSAHAGSIVTDNMRPVVTGFGSETVSSIHPSFANLPRVYPETLNLKVGQVLASGLESCGSAVSKVTTNPTTKFAAFGAAGIAVGTGMLAGAAYGAQAAYDYMYPAAIPVPVPVKPELTRLEKAKELFNNSYNSSVSFAKTYPKSIGAVAATAVIGSLAWKYRGSIFGKSKQAEVVTPVVTGVPVVKTQPRTTLTD